MSRMTVLDRVQLTFSLLAYFILCCTGLFFGVREFNGILGPMDPDVCVTQNITFTSELLEDPNHNFSIGFAVKDISTNGKYVAVDYDRITKINETISQFTMYNITLENERATEVVYVYVSSYYWQEFGDIDNKLQLGEISSSRIYPLPEEVQDFKCIVMNYVSMRCTWTYGKEYGLNMPEVIFRWRTPTFSWNNCLDLSIEDGYCNWNGSTAGYIKNTNITVRLTLRQKCDINVSTDFHIDTQRIVKPNRVSSISTKVLNSTCIQLLWRTADSEPHHPKEHRVIVSNKGVEITNKRFNTTEVTEQHPHNWTFCKLHPYTEYTFSVSIQPIGWNSGYFSDPRNTTAMTYSDIPSASPELTEGGYSWHHKACDGKNQKRNVCIFWKSIKDEHKNGQMRGLRGLFTAINTQEHSDPYDWAEDLTYGCSELLCRTSYNFTIKARNVNGTSERSSTLRIPSVPSGINRPQFIVESANTSDVHISWDYREKHNAKEFIVAWCRNKNGDCKTDHEVNWKSFPSNTKEAVLQINTSANDFLYGVSVLTGQASSGVEWQDCVYMKDTLPTREPQNVVVSAGSDDNTLVVTWDKLTCKSEEPYINMYNLLSNKLHDRYEKALNVTQSSEARVVLKDLEEDQTYLVTVRGITKDGRYGPPSQQVSGIPVNKSLKPSEITGISMAVLLCVIFAAVGCVCVVRRCKQKAQKAIEQAGAITIPDDPDFYTSFGRQNSNDSGFDLTPPPDKIAKGRDLSSLPYVIPYDYRYASTSTNEEGSVNDTNAFKPELMRAISGPEMSVSQNELFCEASKITRESKLMLVIPKPLVFTEQSESGISISSEENDVTVDTLKARSSSDYVQCKRTSFNSEDDNDSELQTKGLSNDNFNVTSIIHCDNKHTQLTHEEPQDEINNLFPLSKAQSIANIPCPSHESSTDDENELPLSLTEENCQNFRHTASPIAISQSELPITSTSVVIHKSTNSKPSNYVTTMDANSLFLQSTSVSTDLMRNKSDINSSPNNSVVSKQSAEPQTDSEYVTLPQYSKSDMKQKTDTSMVDDESKKFPSTGYVHHTAQYNAYDSPQNLGAVHEQYFSKRSVPADISVTQNVTLSNNAHQLMQHRCAIQTSSSDFQNQSVSSINAFEPETSSSNVEMNCEMASTSGYIPHSNAVQDKVIDDNALESTKAAGYVPHANMITDNVPSNDVQSYIPHGAVETYSGIESKTDSNSTPITGAISNKFNLGYVLSTNENGVCQPTERNLDLENTEVVNNLDNYVSHTDVNILNEQLTCPLTKPYKHKGGRHLRSETTEDMANVSAQDYVHDMFVMQNGAVSVKEKANTEQETECERVPMRNDGYIPHVGLQKEK